MKRKLLKKMMAVCTVLGAVCAVSAGVSVVQAETKNNQAPVLSGTNYIQVLKGESFEEKDILNRVYAMDYEDGDLNKKIRIVSNDVNEDQVGMYSVVYEVADKKGAKDTFTTAVEVVEEYNEFGTYVQKTLYTKENAQHLLNVELYRGYHHDRQHLGIYLKEGSTLYVSLVNGAQVNEGRAYPITLRMDILGDDSEVEKEYVIPNDGSWIAIPSTDVTEDLVPFVRTPECEVEPVLQYYYLEDEMEELTYYAHGDEETAFFNTWNSNDQQYAVVEGERMTMLIPRRDKDSILNNATTREEYRFKTLDGMLEYFKALQDQYDAFAGLVWDADAGVDKNIRARYFAKADATGVGAAYYSAGQYTAENAESMNGYLKRDWMTMHEVAHGYDSSLAYGNVPLVECINNMFGYFYEKNTLAEGDNGWSSMQNFELVEQRYMDQIKAGKTFNSMDFDARLYGMVNVLTFGDAKEMMSDLYHAWRVDGGKSAASDFLVEQFSDTTGYNLVPYFEEYGLEISELVKSRIYEKNYPIANRFAYHFATLEDAQKAKRLVGDLVNGLYGLASSEEMASAGLYGDVKLTIQIDDFAQLKGKEVSLMDGAKEIASAVIEGEELSFTKLPIGTYRVMLPAAKGAGYYAEYSYVAVCANKETEDKVVYHKNTSNEMKDDASIVLLGLSDKTFATVSTDIDHGTVIVTTEKIQPHYYFTDPANPYGTIVVEDKDGSKLYTRSYVGSENYEYEVEQIKAPVGSKIYVKHQEIGSANITERRVQVKSNVLAELIPGYMAGYEAKDYTVVFEVTEQGLKRIDWNAASFDEVRSYVVDELLAFMEQISGAKENRSAYQKVKAMAAGLVATFQEEVQAGYESKYPYLFEEESEGEPTPTPPASQNPFADVKEGQYYYAPVLWAVEHKITSGLSADTFGVGSACTREQIVTFLWNFAGQPQAAQTTCAFTDVNPSHYYYKAMLWAVENKITSGLSADTFGVGQACTREQIVTFLWNFAKQPSAAKTECAFTDVNAGHYYYKAMLWAVENGVVAGYNNTTFGTGDACTREQIVTFLYRYHSL